LLFWGGSGDLRELASQKSREAPPAGGGRHGWAAARIALSGALLAAVAAAAILLVSSSSQSRLYAPLRSAAPARAAVQPGPAAPQPGRAALERDPALGPLRWAAGGPYVDGHVLLGFRRGTSAAHQLALEHDVGGLRLRRLGVDALLTVPRGQVFAVIGRLRGDHAVRFAEPDYVMESSGVPNDPSFGLQWGLQNTGQVITGPFGTPVTGTPGADEHVVPAWAVTTGSRSVVIAETDTGVEYTHPDLAANMWSNPGGLGGCAAGTHGFNVVAGENACDPMDQDTVFGGHGTHVAGIMGAVGNNGVGVIGVNWNTSIMAVKWLDALNKGLTSNLIAALQLVIQAKQAGQNIRVVNDSVTFVGTAFSQALSDEIDQLGANDILIDTAAGNQKTNDDVTPRYPCNYDRPNEICVAASDEHDQIPFWANYGPGSVDLAAPGQDIYSTLRGGTYGYINGSSMAAAEVSGAAALILSVGYQSATALKADILNNVDPIPALSGKVRTGGRLDICKALPGCSTTPPIGPPTSMSLALSPQSIPADGASTSTATATVTDANGNRITGNQLSFTSDDAGLHIGAVTDHGDGTYTATLTSSTTPHQVTVTATDSSATPTITGQATLTQTAPTPTFGKTSVGANSDRFAPDRKRVNRYALTADGTVTKLSIYLQPTSTSGQQVIQGVIYADSGGTPSSLLGATNPLTFTSTNTAGWYDLTFPTPPNLAAGNYWLGVLTGNSSGVAGFRYDSVASSRDYNSNTFTSGPSNPFGPITTDSEQTSLYATYTPAPPPSAPPGNTSLPVVSGTAQVGQTLTTSNGSWSGSPNGYTYVWERCDMNGNNCNPISPASLATSQTYTVSSGDVGSTLEAQVTASNTIGSAHANSAPTATVSSTGVFGKTSVGARSDRFAPDRKRVNRWPLTTSGTVTKLSIYLQPTSTSGQQVIQGVIYADSGGTPGSLVATTNAFTFTSTNTAGWYDLTFPTPPHVAAGNYWLGVLTGNSSGVAGFRYDSVSGSRDYNSNAFTSTPSNPFGPVTTDSEQTSLYATYTIG
jgi:subtilisin family serine protease